MLPETVSMSQICFNLVIEVLLVSSLGIGLLSEDMAKFQSRNRGAFGFKVTCSSRMCKPSDMRFNLVIEVLLVSRSVAWQRTAVRDPRFNLVIEVLLVSSRPKTALFASRDTRFNLVIEVLLVSRAPLLEVLLYV